jgi:hypothetical protein
MRALARAVMAITQPTGEVITTVEAVKDVM